MIALTGDRAGQSQVLVGRNFDWPLAEAPVVVDSDATGGLRCVQVGFASTVGAYTGMNEAGLAIAVERIEKLGAPTLDGPPIDMVLHDALLHDRSVAETVARIEAAPHLRGYHVLLADAVPENSRVIELGPSRVTRTASSGILLGAVPAETPQTDADYRYQRVNTLLRSERVIDSDELAKLLRDVEPGRSGMQAIYNIQTRHSVVMEPRYKRIHICLPGPDGTLGKPFTISLRKSTP